MQTVFHCCHHQTQVPAHPEALPVGVALNCYMFGLAHLVFAVVLPSWYFRWCLGSSVLGGFLFVAGVVLVEYPRLRVGTTSPGTKCYEQTLLFLVGFMVSLGRLDPPFSTLQSVPFISQDSLLLWRRVGDQKVGDRRIYLCLLFHPWMSQCWFCQLLSFWALLPQV